MAVTDYRQLDVWSKAMDIAEAVYAASKQMPKQEEYRLTAQMIRAAISIPANIAEGNLRATRRDYARFVSVAQGSTAELETLLLLAERAKLARNCEAFAGICRSRGAHAKPLAHAAHRAQHLVPSP